MTPTPENINLAMSVIDRHELIGAKILVNPQRYKDMERLKEDEQIRLDAIKKIKDTLKNT